MYLGANRLDLAGKDIKETEINFNNASDMDRTSDKIQRCGIGQAIGLDQLASIEGKSTEEALRKRSYS